MKYVDVKEDDFVKHLKDWHSAGRSLLNLPKIDSKNGQLSISLISIDNTRVFTLNKTFTSYQALLSWYGNILDQC